MKRIVFILLSAMLVFGLAACGREATIESQAEDTVSTEEQDLGLEQEGAVTADSGNTVASAIADPRKQV